MDRSRSSETFWDFLSRRLAEIGMSQSELSRQVGISIPMLQKYRTKGSSPRVKTLRKMAKPLRLPFEELARWVPEDERDDDVDEDAAEDERLRAYEALVEDYLEGEGSFHRDDVKDELRAVLPAMLKVGGFDDASPTQIDLIAQSVARKFVAGRAGGITKAGPAKRTSDTHLIPVTEGLSEAPGDHFRRVLLAHADKLRRAGWEVPTEKVERVYAANHSHLEGVGNMETFVARVLEAELDGPKPGQRATPTGTMKGGMMRKPKGRR